MKNEKDLIRISVEERRKVYTELVNKKLFLYGKDPNKVLEESFSFISGCRSIRKILRERIKPIDMKEYIEMYNIKSRFRVAKN
jgi:hypothetical protein